MRLSLLGVDGGVIPGCQLPCFLLNDNIVIDCGSLAYALALEEQLKIEHIFISHAHLDHVCTLPFLANNIMDNRGGPVPVYGCVQTLESLKRHLFNDILWPDFTQIPSADQPILRLIPLVPEVPVTVGGLKVSPLPVNHTIATMAFIVEEKGKAVLIGGDTGPTDRLWEVCNTHPDLRAVFMETSFPDRLSTVAKLSGHLTPTLLGRELQKMTRPIPVHIMHLKPAFREEILEELFSLGDSRIQVAEAEKYYEW